MPWLPTTVLRPDKPYDTATATVRVNTDAGPAFLKALGNRGGPHLLAAELVGTKLAHWFGLPIFDFAIVTVTDEDEIEFYRGGHALPGPAFVTREQSGQVWGGDEEILTNVVNSADIARLVLFDTWTRNCDRYPPDLNTRLPNYNNVYLSSEDLGGSELQLVAMDHTHCFNCGNDLTNRLARIDFVQDERPYGLFPPFRRYLDTHRAAVEADLARLAAIPRAEMGTIVAGIPAAWQVDALTRAALVDLLCQRGNFLSRQFVQMAYPTLPLPPETPEQP